MKLVNKMKIGIAMLILCLSVGFAALNTSLFIDGSAQIAKNVEDFRVYFSSVYIDGVANSTVISEDKRSFTFTSGAIQTWQEQVIDYRVTNASTQYDADVDVVCTPSSTEFLSTTNVMLNKHLIAGSHEKGKLTINATKAGASATVFTCTLEVVAVERTEKGEEIDLDPISEGIVLTYSMTPIPNWDGHYYFDFSITNNNEFALEEYYIEIKFGDSMSITRVENWNDTYSWDETNKILSISSKDKWNPRHLIIEPGATRKMETLNFTMSTKTLDIKYITIDALYDGEYYKDILLEKDVFQSLD